MHKKITQKNTDWDELSDIDELLMSDASLCKTSLSDNGSQKGFVSSKKKALDKERIIKQESSFEVEKNQAIAQENAALNFDEVEGKKRRRSALVDDGETKSEAMVLGYTERNKRLMGQGAGEVEFTDKGEDTKKEFNRLFAKGVSLLGIREHSVLEMTNKLNARTEYEDIVFEVIDELLENSYLSNERFTESYVRSKRNKGFGPVKIRIELKAKGIGNRLIAEKLLSESPEWIDVAREQFEKKYKSVRAENYKEWTKRARFMQGRGFTMEHIQAVLPSADFY